MTITQRIELRRLGYSKEEIAELAELEKVPDPVPESPPEEAPAPDPVPETPAEAPAPAPDISAQLLAAINNLTMVMQNKNLVQTPQPVPEKIETGADIMNSILKG